MRTNPTQIPLLALAGLALHGVASLVYGDTYVDQAGDFSPPITIRLVAHFPLDNNGNSTIGGFEADTVRDVNFLVAGANRNTSSAASFNGSSSVIQHAFSRELNTANFTLACWVKLNFEAFSIDSPVTSRFSDGTSSRGFEVVNDAGGFWRFMSGNGPLPGTWQSTQGQST